MAMHQDLDLANLSDHHLLGDMLYICSSKVFIISIRGKGNIYNLWSSSLSTLCTTHHRQILVKLLSSRLHPGRQTGSLLLTLQIRPRGHFFKNPSQNSAAWLMMPVARYIQSCIVAGPCLTEEQNYRSEKMYNIVMQDQVRVCLYILDKPQLL